MKAILTLVVLFLGVAGCTSNAPEKEKVYDVKGKVVSLEPEKKKVTLDHEAIPGLMTAMTMPFDVENATMLDGLKAGDQVQGKLRRKDGTSVFTELKKQ